MDEHQFVALDETHGRDICSWRSLQRDRACYSFFIDHPPFRKQSYSLYIQRVKLQFP